MIENNIKNLRKKHSVSQTELADAVLSTRQTIYLAEKNKVIPSLELAFKLSRFFKVPIEDIFQYESKSNKQSDVFFIFEK